MHPAILSLVSLLLLTRHHVAVSGVAVHVTAESTSGLCRLETSRIRFLTCTGSEITEVPTIEAGLDVKIFNLDACGISAIGPNSFSNLTSSLTYLSIRSTVQINSMDENAFKNLASLTELLVIAPSMQDKPISMGGLLRSLSSLTFLNIENVKLGDLPSEFAAGTKLANLRLINTEIVSLASDAFARLSSLTILDLSRNQASSYISDLLRQIGSVQNLTMNDCELTQVRIVTTFSRLSKINMDRNKLNLVEFGSMSGVGTTLEELSFNNNQLGAGSLPGLETLTALRRLFLVNNPIKMLPSKMSQLEGLEILDARLTSVSNIRVGDFHERSRLTALRLIEAPITLIELTAFGRLSYLADLSITLPNSPVLVTSVTETRHASWSDVVSRLPALRNLTLSGILGSPSNLDDTIWPGLKSCQQLRRLTLPFNDIRKVPDFQFAQNSIDYLNLQGNSIKEINSVSLYGLAPTAQINLRDNSLSTLDNCSLAGLKSLAGVQLWGNPWRCDCSLVWLLERLRADVGADAMKLVTCAQPDSLRGRSWSDLVAKDFCPSDSVASPGQACEVRIPTTAPTTFPYPLDIRLSLDPGQEQLLVRMVVNTSGLASRFNRYMVRFGLVSEYDLSSRVQEAMISVTTLLFPLDVAETHKFCVILRGLEGRVENPVNCRLFLPVRPEGRLTAAHISAAVVVPIIALVLLGVLIFCLLSRRARRDARQMTTQQTANENPYAPVNSDDNPHFQAARKPESRRFTKRSGSTSNNLDGSRTSLAASASNLQQQAQIQQLQQLQQLQQMQRMHTMSMTGGRQSDPFSPANPGWDARAIRTARSTDQLMTAHQSTGYPGRARSQEFILDHPNLQRSRSGFSQYPADADDVPPPLPARNPSRVVIPQEEEYEQMDA